MIDQPAVIEVVYEAPANTVAYSVEKYELMLYYYPECHYSKRVLDALKQMGKTIPMKNIRIDRKAQNELFEIGGKAQVPCLVINGEALYESSAIIRWLKQHQDEY